MIRQCTRCSFPVENAEYCPPCAWAVREGKYLARRDNAMDSFYDWLQSLPKREQYDVARMPFASVLARYADAMALPEVMQEWAVNDAEFQCGQCERWFDAEQMRDFDWCGCDHD